MLDRNIRVACTLSFLWLATTPAAFAAGKPDAVTPDGGSYYGPLVGGKLHGRGRIEWPSGVFLTAGDFANGTMSGQGRVQYRDGRTYRGAFVGGEFDGKGR